jgi:hypothetical protein
MLLDFLKADPNCEDAANISVRRIEQAPESRRYDAAA